MLYAKIKETGNTYPVEVMRQDEVSIPDDGMSDGLFRWVNKNDVELFDK